MKKVFNFAYNHQLWLFDLFLLAIPSCSLLWSSKKMQIEVKKICFFIWKKFYQKNTQKKSTKIITLN